MGFRGSRVQISASRPNSPNFQRLSATLSNAPRGLGHSWDIRSQARQLSYSHALTGFNPPWDAEGEELPWMRRPIWALAGIGAHILSMAGWLCIPIHQRWLVAISSDAFRLAKSTPPSTGRQYDKSRLSAKRRRPFGCCLVASAHSSTLVVPRRAVPANPDRARRTVSMLCAGRSEAPHAAHGLPAVPRRRRRCAAAPPAWLLRFPLLQKAAVGV